MGTIFFPDRDGTSRFPMALRGDKSPVVGLRGGVSWRFPSPSFLGLITGCAEEEDPERRRWSAGRPPPGRSAMGGGLWPAGFAITASTNAAFSITWILLDWDTDGWVFDEDFVDALISETELEAWWLEGAAMAADHGKNERFWREGCRKAVGGGDR
jgi:hypothetical protein